MPAQGSSFDRLTATPGDAPWGVVLRQNPDDVPLELGRAAVMGARLAAVWATIGDEQTVRVPASFAWGTPCVSSPRRAAVRWSSSTTTERDRRALRWTRGASLQVAERVEVSTRKVLVQRCAGLDVTKD